MFTMELIGNAKRIVTTISDHNVIIHEDGYEVTDVGRFIIDQELYLLEIRLKENDKLVGMRVLPIPFNFRAGDTVELNWRFNLLIDKGDVKCY